MSLANYYFETWNYYNSIYKGGNGIALLMQVGSFYEILETVDSTIGNAKTIADTLNIILTKKNKNVEESPFMCGFPCVSLQKYLPVLITNRFTVIQIDQCGENERKVSQIYSLSTPPEDLLGNRSDPIIMSIHSERDWNLIGVSLMNTDTGELEVVEYTENARDKLIGLLKWKNPSEIILTYRGDKGHHNLTWLTEEFGICHQIVLNKSYLQIDVQEEYIKKVYSAGRPVGMLGYLVEFDLERMIEGGVVSLLNLFDFLYVHHERFLMSPPKPKIIMENTFLQLSSDISDQLSIFGTNSLFSFIDSTKTVIGRRSLRALLSRPFIECKEIEYRYNLSNEFMALDDITFKFICETLSKIRDIESITRSLQCSRLTSHKLHLLYTSCCAVRDILNRFKSHLLEPPHLLHSFIGECIDKFVFNDSSNLSSAPVPFKRGNYNELDSIKDKIEEAFARLKEIEGELLQITPVKLTFVEGENRYVFLTTNIRANELKKHTFSKSFEYLSNKSGTKVWSPETERLSEIIHVSQKNLSERSIQLFKNLQNQWNVKYSGLFGEIIHLVRLLDVAQSNVTTSKKYNYCCPQIGTNDGSFIDIKDLRHPIIERIIQTEYITNDIALGGDKQVLGGIVYSLNSGGKSSLLRSIGISIILAQCGLFVPAKSFKFYPFKKLISQVDFVDNLFRSQSSFVSEMLGLKKILQEGDPFTLVLADELCKGSEINSATAIFASAVEFLVQCGTKFLMSTHLHGVSQLDSIKEMVKGKLLKIWNLGVEVRKDTIVFLRKLREGPCDTLYGLEIARSLGLNDKFIKRSFEIREKIVGKKNNVLTTKGSRYNKLQMMDCCEICKYSPTKKTDIPLDCHHISFQMNGCNGFCGSSSASHVPLHAKSNLVTLCKHCHQKVHKGEIEIKGWLQTTRGRELTFNSI
jgi:DNA mismatch repair protein MutS